MKKLLFLFAAAFLLSTGLHARDSSKTKTTTTDKTTKMKDCYMMKNGKMIMEKNGTTTDMTQDATLSNGTLVTKNGTVKTKDGKTITLKEGECVYMNGKIKPAMSSAKKSTPQK
jgi:hypothetical protein